jgi:hypothetical protein
MHQTRAQKEVNDRGRLHRLWRGWQVTFLLASAVTVLLPFAIERFYFRRKCGPFAILLLVFLAQAGMLFGVEALLEGGAELPVPIAAIGALAYLTIGFTPMVGVVLSALFLILLAVEKFSQGS